MLMRLPSDMSLKRLWIHNTWDAESSCTGLSFSYDLARLSTLGKFTAICPLVILASRIRAKSSQCKMAGFLHTVRSQLIEPSNCCYNSAKSSAIKVSRSCSSTKNHLLRTITAQENSALPLHHINGLLIMARSLTDTNTGTNMIREQLETCLLILTLRSE
jgi:hypothetical protein